MLQTKLLAGILVVVMAILGVISSEHYARYAMASRRAAIETHAMDSVRHAKVTNPWRQ